MVETMAFKEIYFENNISYTTADDIAEQSGNDRRSVMNLVRNYSEMLKIFGDLLTKDIRLSDIGRPRKEYLLNEQQATLIITFLDNTEKVTEFKKNLVI